MWYSHPLKIFKDILCKYPSCLYMQLIKTLWEAKFEIFRIYLRLEVIVPTVVEYFFQSDKIQEIHENKYKNTFH